MSESVFTYGAPGLKFGPGASDEIGFDLVQTGARRVLLVTDRASPPPGTPPGSRTRSPSRGLEVTTYDQVHVEPTDESLSHAVDFARDGGPFDAVVAVGGGSAIDTAKAVNLLLTNPGELMDYINAPVGKAVAPVNALLPLVAVPTTTGTGSESTTICVLDVLSLHVKTGISHPRLRPTLAVVDPAHPHASRPWSPPRPGMDILCHALESYTARWYADFDAKQPEQRVPYCGANPIADMWSERSLSLLAGAFRARRTRRLGRRRRASRWRWPRPSPASASATRASTSRTPTPTRSPAGCATTGRGLPRRRADRAARDGGLADRAGGVPAAPSRPPRTGTCGRRGCSTPTAPADGPDALPGVLLTLMRDIGIPSGLAEVGYGDADVDDLVAGSLQQQRLLATAPRRRDRRRPGGRLPRVHGALVTDDLVAELQRRGRHRCRRLRPDPGALLVRRVALPGGAAGRGPAAAPRRAAGGPRRRAARWGCR